MRARTKLMMWAHYKIVDSIVNVVTFYAALLS